MNIKEYSSYIIAFAASLVRYYDYALFGLSASMISRRFMPEGSADDQMLVFFLIFSVSVCARPMGSVIFGHIGDNISRIFTVKITTSIAAISTISIAFIPSYSSIGWISVLLLTICRMLFLASLAGESDVIKIYIAEKIDQNHRHFANSLVSFFGQTGSLIAAYVYYLATTNFVISDQYSDTDIMWRLNFIYGGLAGILLLFFKKFYIESDLFIKYQINRNKRTKSQNNHYINIIKNNNLEFILAAIIQGINGASYNFLIIFFGGFSANILGLLSQTDAASNNIILIAVYAFGGLLAGILADRVLSMRQVLFSLIVVIFLVFVWCFFLVANNLAFIIQILLVFFVPFYVIPLQIKLQSMFSIGHRVRMYSLSHSLGSMIFSSTIPFCSMLIWRYTTSIVAIMSLFLLFLSILLIVSLYITQKTYIDQFDRII